MNFRWYPAMHRRGSGLTLIELLVATAALGLVGMLFLVALQTPKSNRRTPPTKSLQVSDVMQVLTAQPSDRQTPFVGNTSRTGPNKPQLVLRLVSMTTPVRLDQKKAICAILFNQGDAPATLVLPGDGSYEARRTPVVMW